MKVLGDWHEPAPDAQAVRRVAPSSP